MLYIDGILIDTLLASRGWQGIPPWRHGGLNWQANIELFMVAFPAMELMTPEGSQWVKKSYLPWIWDVLFVLIVLDQHKR